MNVNLDYPKCSGYANCLDAAPEVFDLDERDKAIVLIPQPSGENAEAARKAAKLCPVAAIIISDD